MITNDRLVMRLMLGEPTMCDECSKVYTSAFPLRSCYDHRGYKELYAREDPDTEDSLVS